MKRSALNTLPAACALLITPVAASAQTVGPLNPAAPIVNEVTELTSFAGGDILQFAKFNPVLGALTSVSFSGSASLSSLVTITNNAATSSKGSVFTQSGFTFKAPDNANLLALTVNTNSYAYNLAPGTSVTTSPALQGSQTGSAVYTNPAILALFIGPGTVDIGVSTGTFTFMANNGGNTAASQITRANATGTITYTYSASPSITESVPEPGVTALLAGAGAGASLLALRRRGNCRR
jgi:hypothetical protein